MASEVRIRSISRSRSSSHYNLSFSMSENSHAWSKSYVLGYVEKASHQLWIVPIKPLSYTISSVLGPTSGTTFITQTSLSFKAAANDPKFAFLSITFLIVSGSLDLKDSNNFQPFGSKEAKIHVFFKHCTWITKISKTGEVNWAGHGASPLPLALWSSCNVCFHLYASHSIRIIIRSTKRWISFRCFF